MNLSTTLEIRAYGTSEGVTKAWDTRGRTKKTYNAAKGVSWETASGHATKTGTKERQLAEQRIAYFVKNRGFTQVSHEEARHGHFLYMNLPHRTEYADKSGNKLSVSTHPDKNIVDAHLDADESTHRAFDTILRAKNFKKLQYELYKNEWAGSDRQRAIVGSIEIYAAEDTICVDYDDTMATEDGLDEEGIKLAKWIIKKGFKLVILTARKSTWDAIKKRLAKAGVKATDVTDEKPPALAYIDNKAIHWRSSAKQAIHDIKHIITHHQ